MAKFLPPIVQDILGGKIFRLDDFPVQTLVSHRSDRRDLPKNFVPGNKYELNQDEKIILLKTFEEKLGVSLKDEHFRLRHSSRADAPDKYVHADPWDITGTIFLEASQAEGGFYLEFFRHLSSGLREIIPGPSTNVKVNFLIDDDRMDLSRWEVWHREEYKYGCCICHAGRLFHAPPVCDSADGGWSLDFFMNVAVEGRP
ncbi:MAG: hypothetical protein ACJ76H_12990 [Bacteriovoracaceae bacterium]